LYSGQSLAILSAALFGVSPVLCKLVIGDMSPALLAGLLYLGSGIGLQILLVFQGRNPLEALRRLPSMHRRALFGSVISGGIVAPLLIFTTNIISMSTRIQAELNRTITTMFTSRSSIPTFIGRTSIAGININFREECHETDYFRNHPVDMLFFVRSRTTRLARS